MSEQVSVKNDVNGVVVIIRPRPGHFVTVISLCGIVLLIVLTGVSFLTAITAWGFPILGIVFFEIWQNFAQQRIGLYEEKIIIERWLGSSKLGEAIEIDVSIIRNVGIEELSYKSRGGSYVSRILAFSSDLGVVAKSWQLSAEDARALLEGPFRRFGNPGEMGCTS